MDDRTEGGAIRFAEKILELVDESRYTATYKYALLLALIDLCLEGTEKSGAAPDVLTTRQLAEKIVQLYWSHTARFAGLRPADVLRQNTNGQAEIVSAISRFRARHASDPSVPHWESRLNAPKSYERLVRFIEWKLIEMPLPRLQTVGQSTRPFIYEIAWDQRVEYREVRQYQSSRCSGFDNRVTLKPGVGEYFLQLNSLLRPLIQRRWAAMVAQLNRLHDSRLEMFLFGAERMRTAKIRTGLWDVQGRHCFYCGSRITEPSAGEVDHFVPWSRYPDDGLDNYVIADGRCNRFKSSSLAATDHLVRWTTRLSEGTDEYVQLSDLATTAKWDRQPIRSLNVASAIYLRLPPDAMLWVRGREFAGPDAQKIAFALQLRRPSL